MAGFYLPEHVDRIEKQDTVFTKGKYTVTPGKY